MANWKYKLNMQADWILAEERAIDAKELARRVAAALVNLNCADPDLDDIISQFDALPADADFDDFDEVLTELYDWGDQEVPPYGQWPPNKMCWVGTIL